MSRVGRDQTIKGPEDLPGPWAFRSSWPRPLLPLGLEFRPSVLGPAGLGVLAAHRPVLAVADDGDAGRLDALRDEIVAGGAGASLAQGHVVLVGSSLVAVSLDDELGVPVGLQPLRVALEHLRVAGSD